MAAIANKRKREADNMPNPRPAPNMTNAGFDDHGMTHGDNDMGFAAALAQHNADVNDPANQLHQQGHIGHESRETGGPSASDTAAAAMAQFHTMTVPQSTEQEFMSQPNPNMDDHHVVNNPDPHGQMKHRDSSFGEFDVSVMKDDSVHSNGQTSPIVTHSQSGPKPAAGTEEWHKVRRDNHKEGEYNVYLSKAERS